ncbi:WD40 repeat domain-containing protein [Streptomyces sp. NPDC060194]|uniref:WD40 repeat domain-containing protein n=1 Tax=Streptomyces sp. NPDC060194 TaxID=3347069 RepID=UPI00364C3762
MRSYSLCAAVAASALLLVPVGNARADDGGFTMTDPRIVESSGLAASREHPGIYWTHNDQDSPRVFAVDSRTGRTVATVTLRGVGTPRDMEAIAVGPGGVYVGDIGDNLNGSWDHVWIYEFPEPAELKGDITVTATQYDVKYADGPRDAESLLVHPVTGRAYIVSKNEAGGGFYAGPQKLRAGVTNTFTRVADLDLWATDGAFSPDGKRLAVRGYFGGRTYDWDAAEGRPVRERSADVPLQRQGESVTYSADGSALMYGSEGAGSGVVRVPLSGEERAESPRPRASSSPGAGGDGAGGAAGDDAGGSVSGTGLLVIGIGVAAVLGLRRVLKGRPSRGR